MNKTIAWMLIVCTFDMISQMLREPEKFSQETRNQAADSLAVWMKGMQKELTGELMSEAVRDVPDAKS